MRKAVFDENKYIDTALRHAVSLILLIKIKE